MDEWFKDWFDDDYAALYAHRDEAEATRAVETLLEIAPVLASGPVLDLGCGAGRHLRRLRRTNPLAFGLDLSPHLLGLAPPELRGWLVRGDMRRLPVRPGSLAGICLWFTPFGYFGDEENRALLHRLRNALASDGILLLDLMNPARMKADLVAEDVSERGGMEVRSRRSLEGNRIVKRMTIVNPAKGTTREAVESVRVYSPEELRGMAQACGLSVARELGDYDGSPFLETLSPRWIVMLRIQSAADR